MKYLVLIMVGIVMWNAFVIWTAHIFEKYGDVEPVFVHLFTLPLSFIVGAALGKAVSDIARRDMKRRK